MTESAQATVLYYEFEKYTVEITATYLMVQWINGNIVFELISRGYYILCPTNFTFKLHRSIDTVVKAIK